MDAVTPLSLAAFTEAVGGAFEQADLAVAVADGLRGITGARACRLFVTDSTLQTLVPAAFCAAAGRPPVGAFQPVPLYRAGKPNLLHDCAYATITGQVVAIDDAYGFSGYELDDIHAFDRLIGGQTVTLLTFPLRSADGIALGAVQLCDPATDEWLMVALTLGCLALGHRRAAEERNRLTEVLKTVTQQSQRQRAPAQRRRPARFPGLVGTSEAMQTLRSTLARLTDNAVTVLLNGETGAGKEVVARALVEASVRKDKPFVVQNCAAIPAELLESELFGHRKGAFTGAHADKTGLFVAADGGTLFLDEMGELPLDLQAKLLRVLQEGEVRPLGSLDSKPVDVRVIAATNVDLDKAVADGRFRQDLYYRLAVVKLTVPPLRERLDDVPILIDHLLARLAKRHGRAVPLIEPRVIELLQGYDYPGNVRELRNIIEHALLMVDEHSSIRLDHLPPELVSAHLTAQPPVNGSGAGRYVLNGDGLKGVVAQVERDVIADVLAEENGNQTRAAERLGISRRALVDKLTRYALRG